MTELESGFCGCAACRVLAAGPPVEAPPEVAGEAGKPVWTLDQVVDQLLRWNAAWAEGPIAYAFYTKTPAHLSGNPDYGGFKAFTAAEQDGTRRALASIADVAQLSFVETGDNGAAVGPANRRLTYAASTSTAQYFTAYASVDVNGPRIDGAEMMFNAVRWNGSAALGGRQYYVLIHETLHGLGLPHPANYNRNANEEIVYDKHAQFFQDSLQYTVMSYFGGEETGAQFKGLYPTTPMLHDIAALQALYGVNTTARLGDTTYGFNSNAGPAYDLASQPQGAVFSIWDAGGNDTLDLSGYTQGSTVDLNPGAFSSAGGLVWNISVAFGAEIEGARGGSGADSITGNGLANALSGGAGDDFLDGRGGRDNMFGDAGNDHMVGGGDGDRLHGQDGDDLIGGQDGDDYVDGGAGRDNLFGDAGADHMIGGSDGDRLHGQDGDDLIGGQDGDDFIDGGTGRDNLFGDAGADHLIGGIEGDRLHGQGGDDLVGGQDGDDYIDGGDGRDTLYGDAGNDHLIGGSENDALVGQDGDDLMGGQDGNDFILGGGGGDTLYGDAGDDWIEGGAGADRMDGGAGADRFVLSALGDSRPGTADRIADFSAGAGDLIDLSRIDADLGLDGDQAFTWATALSGRAGEAASSYDAGSNTTSVSFDVDGDGQADGLLLLAGSVGTGAGWVL